MNGMDCPVQKNSQRYLAQKPEDINSFKFYRKYLTETIVNLTEIFIKMLAYFFFFVVVGTLLVNEDLSEFMQVTLLIPIE